MCILFSGTTREDCVDIQAWKRWRTHMILFCSFGSFYCGLVYSIYYPTEYLYIKGIVQSSQSILYFSIATGLQNGMSVIASLVGSIYYDFTLNAKKGTRVVISLIILGNILYVLHFSIVFIVIGNAFIGCVTGATSMLMAEIIHILEDDKVMLITAIVCGCKTAAMFVGPALSYAFVKVDVYCGKWRLNFGNLPAILIGCLSILLLLCTILIRNVAKTYDLKSHTEKERKLRHDLNADEDPENADNTSLEHFEMDDFSEDTMSLIEENPSNSKPKSVKAYFVTAWHILTERHYILTLAAGAIATYSHFLTLNLFTILSIELLSWKPDQVANLRIITMVAGLVAIILIVSTSKRVKSFVVLYGIVCCTVFPLAAVCVLPHINQSAAEVLLYITAFVTGFIDSPLHIASITLIAKLVRAQFQGIAEAVRTSVYFLMFALAALSVSWVYHYLIAGCVFCACLNLISIVVLQFEVKYFMSLA